MSKRKVLTGEVLEPRPVEGLAGPAPWMLQPRQTGVLEWQVKPTWSPDCGPAPGVWTSPIYSWHGTPPPVGSRCFWSVRWRPQSYPFPSLEHLTALQVAFELLDAAANGSLTPEAERLVLEIPIHDLEATWPGVLRPEIERQLSIARNRYPERLALWSSWEPGYSEQKFRLKSSLRELLDMGGGVVLPPTWRAGWEPKDELSRLLMMRPLSAQWVLSVDDRGEKEITERLKAWTRWT